MKIKSFAITILIILLFMNIANAQSTPLSSWINNNVIHYVSSQSAPISSFLNFSFNGSYFYKQNTQYYLNTSIYKPTDSKVGFALATNAYPFPFINNMIKDNVSYCSESRLPSYEQTNFTKDFFFALCGIEKGDTNSTIYNISSNSTVAKNQIKELAQSFMPTDNFTKELYNLYYQYSSICIKPNSKVSNSSLFIDSYCSGTKDNISIPNPISFSDFYQSLYDYMQSTANNNQIEYDELKYDINNGTIFPKVYNSQPIQSYATIAGVYPAILPSGKQATLMAQNATLILPIKTMNETEASILAKNNMDINSGIYNNVTLYVALQEINNTYATYNISTNQSLLQGNQSSGYNIYEDSCDTNNPGLSKVENFEQTNIKKGIYSSLYSIDLYPSNYQSQYANSNQNNYYQSNGSSIIQATISNEYAGNTTITYGVFDPETFKITYENSIKEYSFSNSTKLAQLNIPKSAFVNSKMIIFLNASSPVSYQMNYYEFKENTYAPKYNFSHYIYNITKTRMENETVDNKTYTVYVPYTVTCDAQEVETSIRYNATKEFIGKKDYNYNIQNNQTINVSTNLSVSNILNTNKTNLKYSYVYKNVNISQGNNNTVTKTETKVTLPLMSSFEIFSSNDSLLYSFDSYQFDYNLITSNFTKNLTSISKYIYAYDPSYVYPNTYSSIPSLYPTVEDSYTNTQYLMGISNIEAGDVQNSDLPQIDTALLEGFFIVFNNMISSPTKVGYTESVAINDIKEYSYYKSGCPYGRVGNNCIVNQDFYSYGENDTSTTVFHNYDLLNPSIYTQNSFYAGEEAPDWLCLKASVFSYNLGMALSCVNSNVDNLTHIYVSTHYLNFNTSYGNMTGTEKKEFYEDLENATTNSSDSGIYHDEYSYIHAPTYKSSYIIGNGKILNGTNVTAQYNLNGTITISFTKPFSSLKVTGCDYQICFTNYLSPTNGTINGYYSKYIVNNTAFLYTIEPRLIKISNVSVSQKIELIAYNKTENFTVGKYFILNYINKNTTKVFYEKNITINGQKVQLINIEYPIKFQDEFNANPFVIISFYNNELQYKAINYIMNKNTQTLYFVNYRLNTMMLLFSIILVFSVLYYIGVFREIILTIKSRIKKFKTENL